MRPLRQIPAIAALALAALAAVLLAAPAAAQHHMTGGKADYDDPGGGDPDTPAGCAGATNKVQITGSATIFSPGTITIDRGQPVCWTWNTAGTSHNLKADDGSFSSGQPVSQGTFQRTFTTAGTYGYHCQVHGSPTGGMHGTVVVRETEGEGPGSGPGTISINPGAYIVAENAGSVSITIDRTGGSDGKVTAKIAAAGGSAAKGKDFLPKTAVLTWNPGDAGAKTFSVPIKNDTLTEPDESFVVSLSKPTGGATLGTSSATVTIDDDEGCPSSALLAPAGVKASGQSAREVRVSWAVDAGAAKTMHVERRGGEGDFREVAVLPAGAGEYVDAGLPSGAAFQYRLRAESAEGLSEYSEVAAAATDGAIGPCAAGAHALCLAGGRFEAKVVSRRGEGDSPRAAARAESVAGARSGLFALAPSGDAELMLKVVDGCADNGHYWVQLAAVTDAELAVAVRDTQTGRTWTFFNPAGKAAGVVRDVDAFASCP
ncbi:MAG TPA: Calx-beta domain-containing protein [Thermoanaerobaculia bacterium]|nr:Calx-beta domain-containing protein [Thermoanaerobaculia bacterium]